MKNILHFLCLFCLLVFVSGCLCGDGGGAVMFDFRLPNSSLNIFEEDSIHYKVDSTKVFFIDRFGQVGGEAISLNVESSSGLDSVVFWYSEFGGNHSTYLIHWSFQNYDTIHIDVNRSKKNIFSCDEYSRDY